MLNLDKNIYLGALRLHVCRYSPHRNPLCLQWVCFTCVGQLANATRKFCEEKAGEVGEDQCALNARSGQPVSVLLPLSNLGHVISPLISHLPEDCCLWLGSRDKWSGRVGHQVSKLWENPKTVFYQTASCPSSGRTWTMPSCSCFSWAKFKGVFDAQALCLEVVCEGWSQNRKNRLDICL